MMMMMMMMMMMIQVLWFLNITARSSVSLENTHNGKKEENLDQLITSRQMLAHWAVFTKA